MREFIALVFCELSLLTSIMGIAVPYWGVNAVKSKSYFYFGLWKSCIGSRCIYLTEASTRMNAVRSTELMGMLAIIGACTCLILRLCKLLNQSVIPLVTGVLATSAGVMMTTGLILFAVTEFDVAVNLHAGFGLCVTSAVLAFGAGGVLISECCLS